MCLVDEPAFESAAEHLSAALDQDSGDPLPSEFFEDLLEGSVSEYERPAGMAAATVAVTPWLQVTPDFQVIESGLDRVDTTYIAGIRVRSEF